MKFLSECIWWTHINRMIYFHGKNCSDCIKPGKKLKPLILEKHYNHMLELKFVNEETDLDFTGTLESIWGHCINILVCIDRFSKFPSTKIQKLLRVLQPKQ